MLTFYQISDVIGNKTCEEDFQKIKNARQYYLNFTDYLTTSFLNITKILKLIKLYQLCHKPHGFLFIKTCSTVHANITKTILLFTVHFFVKMSHIDGINRMSIHNGIGCCS